MQQLTLVLFLTEELASLPPVLLEFLNNSFSQLQQQSNEQNTTFRDVISHQSKRQLSN